MLASYDEQAGGAAKGAGLHQLLDTKVLPPFRVRLGWVCRRLGLGSG